MKFRKQHSPLLLLLLPTLAAAFADAPADTVSDRNTLVVRRDIPTKDAPVDGKDGKPHLGPFVETEVSTGGDRSDLKGKPSDWETVDGKKIPELNDGVMFDKNRERPQEGTTGTKGGVTEKDNIKKFQEGKAGGKLQTQPEAPKEQPPLPHSEEEKIKSANKNDPKNDPKTNPKGDSKSDSKTSSEEEDSTSYIGLDVSDSYCRRFDLVWTDC